MTAPVENRNDRLDWLVGSRDTAAVDATMNVILALAVRAADSRGTTVAEELDAALDDVGSRNRRLYDVIEAGR